MTGNEQKAAPKRNYFGRDRFVALIVLAGFLAFRIIDPAPVKILRLKSFDLYQQMKPRPVPPKSPVVIIDIDEASLAEIGQWPWPRNIHAQIVQNLMQMGAAIVAFDAVFAEPDRMNPSGAAPSVPSNDQVFARAMRSHGRVVIGQGATSKPSEENRRPQRAVTIHIVKDGPDPIAWIPEVPALVRNIPVIEDAATGIGSFTLMPESDGIIRRIPTVLRVSKKLYPSLAVEILRVAFQPTFPR